MSIFSPRLQRAHNRLLLDWQYMVMALTWYALFTASFCNEARDIFEKNTFCTNIWIDEWIERACYTATVHIIKTAVRCTIICVCVKSLTALRNDDDNDRHLLYRGTNYKKKSCILFFAPFNFNQRPVGDFSSSF